MTSLSSAQLAGPSKGRERAIELLDSKNGVLGAIKRENRAGTCMAMMPFLGYLIFGLLPMLLSLYISFCKMTNFNIGDSTFIGFDNYISLFTNPGHYVRTAVINTLYYSISVPINVSMSLFLANLLSKPLKGKNVSRVILYIPSVCSAVATTLMWQFIFSEYGVINTLLANLGLEKVGFMTTSKWFMPTCIFISIWMRGTSILQLQSALANVNKSLVEAATLDGASKKRTFFSVTLPSISPTVFYVVVMWYISAFQEMAIMSLIARDDVGPDFCAMTLTNYIYRLAFKRTVVEGFGLASALSWITCIFILVFSRVLFKLSDKFVSYDN